MAGFADIVESDLRAQLGDICVKPKEPPSTAAFRLILEDLLQSDAEDESDFEGGLQGWRVLVLFYGDDSLPRYADCVGEGLLCHVVGGAKLANLIEDGGH